MKAVVVEDSRVAREGLIRLLGAHPEIEIIGSAGDADAACQVIRNGKPDLLFLDINMPGKSGFELLELLDYTPKIIFTTAFSEHAIRSFDFNTVDYLLKPIGGERLAQAIEKLDIPGTEGTSSVEALDIKSRIFIKDGDKCHLIGLEDIRYFQSCKNYSIAYFGDEKAFINKSLAKVEARLPARHFFRANRQYILNLSHIVSIDEWVNNGFKVVLSDHKEIEVSRRHATGLRELLSF